MNLLQSNQLHEIRRNIQRKGHLQMGNNLLIRQAIYETIPQKRHLEQLLPFIGGNIGLVFLKEGIDFNDTIIYLRSIFQYACAVPGQLAHHDVIISRGTTGLSPIDYGYFQLLNAKTRIVVSIIELLEDTKMLSKGEIIEEWHKKLLDMLRMPTPFVLHPITVKGILDDTHLYSIQEWDYVQSNIKNIFWKVVTNTAAIESQTNAPGVATVAVRLHQAARTLSAISMETKIPIRATRHLIPKEPVSSAMEEEEEEDNWNLTWYD